MAPAREFSLYLSTAGGDYAQVRDLTLAAEALGYDAVWLMDNTAGWASAPDEIALLDPWATLPALAEATSRIALGTLATPPGRRHPGVFAKTAATVDRISAGRLEITFGSGDEPQMYPRVGQPFLPARERIAQLREEIEIVRRLWSEESTDFRGRYYQLEGGLCFPKPLREPHPPIWVAIAWGRQLMPRVAADWADALTIAPHAAPDGLVRDLLDIVARRFEEAGRDFSAIPRSRQVNLTFADCDVDVAAFKREVLASARTRPQMEGVGQYWLDIARRQWPDHFPERFDFMDFYDLFECHVAGSPAQVAEQIEARVFDLGFDQVVVWPRGLLRSPEPESIAEQAEDVERFAKEVIPLLRT